MSDSMPNCRGRRSASGRRDHGGYELKEHLLRMLREAGYDVIDFGDQQPKLDDDYPDFVVPLAAQLPTAGWSVAWHLRQRVSGHQSPRTKSRGSGILIHENFSAHQALRTTT